MKKALVELSGRIAEVVDQGEDFPVHESFQWKNVPNDTNTNDTYDLNTDQVIKYVEPE